MITLRIASYNDLAILQFWDQQPHVIASDPNDDWLWEVELGVHYDWRRQFIAERNGLPIGYVEIIDPHFEKEQYWGTIGLGFRAIDIWIGEENNLNQGFGTEIMKQAIQLCFADQSVHTVLIDPLSANTKAHRFYQRFGFKPIDQRHFGACECLVHELLRNDWEAWCKRNT